MGKEISAWERVEIARNPKRKTSLDYINSIFDDFIELHGDRNFKDDKAIVCGLGKIGKQNFTIIAEQKGRTTKENIERNFGMPNPESYRKAIRFMKQAEKFNRPVITFIDTKGAYPGLGAEERGQGEAIAKSMFEMAKLKVPVISIVMVFGVTSIMCPRNMLVYCIISDLSCSVGACILSSASCLLSVVSGFISRTLMISMSLFNCLMICSSVLLSP